MGLDRDFGKNFDSTVTSVHNPWISDVVPPIEQNLHSFEFPEDVETALRNAEELPAQAEDRSGIITNPIIAARKELSDLPEFDIFPVLRVVFTIIIKRETRLSLMLCGIL